MGADRTVELTRSISVEEMEEILRVASVGGAYFNFSPYTRWNERRWDWHWRGWKTNLDIELIEEVTLKFHYAYWNEEHIKRAHDEADTIVKILEKRGLIKEIGEWSL